MWKNIALRLLNRTSSQLSLIKVVFTPDFRTNKCCAHADSISGTYCKVEVLG